MSNDTREALAAAIKELIEEYLLAATGRGNAPRARGRLYAQIDRLAASPPQLAALTEQPAPGRWVAFAEQEPPVSAALDDASVKTPDRVLVTNNLGARDRMGKMSHVWFAAPIRERVGCGSGTWRDGGWVAYDEADRLIVGLTHWFDALTEQPAAPQALTDEQIDRINCEMWASCPLDLPQGRMFARAIERAHGIGAPAAPQAEPRHGALISRIANLEQDNEHLRLEVARLQRAAPAQEPQQPNGDTQLLDFLREESLDLRCIDVPTGGDDYDIRWLVVGHYQGKTRERLIGESFTDEPRDAIKDAIANIDERGNYDHPALPGAASSPAPAVQPEAVAELVEAGQPTYTEQQIADACVEADSKFESLLIALHDAWQPQGGSNG